MNEYRSKRFNNSPLPTFRCCKHLNGDTNDLQNNLLTANIGSDLCDNKINTYATSLSLATVAFRNIYR